MEARYNRKIAFSLFSLLQLCSENDHWLLAEVTGRKQVVSKCNVVSLPADAIRRDYTSYEYDSLYS